MKSQFMLRRKSLLILVFVASILALGFHTQVQAQGRVSLTIGAPPTTSPLYAYYVGLAKSVKSVYPDIETTVTECQGAVDITKRLRQGLVDFGNSTSDQIYESRKGTGAYQDKPWDGLRVLWSFGFNVCQWIVTKTSGVKFANELTDKGFNPGGTGGAIVTVTQDVFNLLGIKPKYYTASQHDAIEAMMNRRIMGTAKMGPVPDGFVMQVAASNPIEVVGLTEAELKRVLKEFPYLLEYKISKGAYSGTQEAKLVTIITSATATKALPQEVGYKLFKAMWEGGKTHWVAAYDSSTSKDIDVPVWTLKSADFLHAGSVQYLKEKGFDVPKHLIPSEYKP